MRDPPKGQIQISNAQLTISPSFVRSNENNVDLFGDLIIQALRQPLDNINTNALKQLSSNQTRWLAKTISQYFIAYESANRGPLPQTEVVLNYTESIPASAAFLRWLALNKRRSIVSDLN